RIASLAVSRWAKTPRTPVGGLLVIVEYQGRNSLGCQGARSPPSGWGRPGARTPGPVHPEITFVRIPCIPSGAPRRRVPAPPPAAPARDASAAAAAGSP